MRQKPTVLARDIVASSRLFRVEEVQLRFSNGVERTYERLVGRGNGYGAVMIVAMIDADHAILVEEYCGGTDEYEISLPKGLIEPGEDVLAAAERELKRQFREREPKKQYVARVWGHPQPAEGLVDLPLICDWPNRPKQKVCYETGKAAQTEYEVLEYAEDNTARVRLKPITGRSHQLRVHMLALGHPILGDRFYATPEALAMAPRLLLHAETLTITHPAYGNAMTFRAPIDF